MPKEKNAPPTSCDWTAGKAGAGRSKRPIRARLYKHRPDYSWTGIRTERYKAPDGTWSGVLRRTLVGGRGERTKFHLRYFEVAPGGHTTFERHGHEHVVVGIRGRGECLVGKKTYEVGFMDTLYIPPDAPHRLENPHPEPFGFICVVDAERDKPRPTTR